MKETCPGDTRSILTSASIIVSACGPPYDMGCDNQWNEKFR